MSDQKTRLLWLIDSFNVGGAESLVLPFTRNYDRNRYELVLCCLTSIGGNPIERQLAAEGVDVINLGAKNLRDVAAFRRLLAVIRNQKIDLIHAHLTYASTWAALASRLTRVPSVATLHVAPPSRGGAAIRDRLMRFALNRWSSKVIMVSDALRTDYLRPGGLSQSKVVVAHNGIEVERFHGDRNASRMKIEREFNIPADAEVIATVSVMRPGKGIEVLLEAARRIRDQRPRAMFLLLGDGEKRAEWESLAAKLAISEFVRWAGHRSDVSEILPGCDILAHPTLADAFPTVLLEAMASGLPVVASSVGGVPEIVEPGITGALVPPGDPAALAAAVVAVLAVAEPMKESARRIGSERFSTRSWLARLDAIYLSALSASPRENDLTPRRGERGAPPKIAFVEFAGKGGMIHYAFQLCRGMAAQGADVTLVTSTDYELEHLDAPFKVERLINLWDPKPAGRLSMTPWAVAGRKLRRVSRAARYYGQWLRLNRYIAETRPDIVLLGDIRFPFDLFPLLLLRRTARNLTDICHNVHPFSAGGKSGGLFDRSRFKRFFYRRIYRLFDRVFVHYDRNRAEFISSFGIPERRVGVIVHGNEEIFRDLRNASVDAAALRRRHRIGDEPVVLFFGTLSRYKGTDILLRAFPSIRAKTNARLVLAGFPFHDFNIAEHQELARSLGISDAVTWVPEYIDSGEIAAWMELASVIVFPYRDIYQSGALHVPQTFGVPIVATAVGAMQDVVRDGESGLLVPPENVEALAAAVTRLLEDRALAARLGSRAAADAQGPFSWASIATTILAKDNRRTT